MKICISSGHGLHIRGASGSPVPPQLDEVDEARRVVERVAEFLKAADVGVATFHDNTSHDQSTNLATITNWHNSKARDLDVSVHFNAYDGKAHGCEVLYVTQESLAAKVSSAMASAGGFTNRGAKYRSDLYVLNNTDEPAILLETCFCDNTSDSNLYRSRFDAICQAIAEAISGRAIEQPPEAERPPIEPPPEPTGVSRPTIGRGDSGSFVVTVQECLQCTPYDGDFGPITEGAVGDYQEQHGLQPDGIVGPKTWASLEQVYGLPPYPPALLPPLDQDTIDTITNLAAASEIARYGWRDRGTAPIGYTKGMAIAWSTVVRRFMAGDSSALEMARADTRIDSVDALSWYSSAFDELGMDNSQDGIDTLRHLWVLLMGLGMRESSGKHCCGRDMSADNVTADTAEAGLFQTSWNASSCSLEMQKLLDEYSQQSDPPQCALDTFAEGVSCSSSDWQSYGSGGGRTYQDLAKKCPQFAAEMTAVGLRSLRKHWGPINRSEAEVRSEADHLFKAIQDLIQSTVPVA